MIHVICRLTAKNRDQLRNHTLGNRVWATFTLFTQAWRREKWNMGLYTCTLYACKSLEPHIQTSPNFLHLLLMAMSMTVFLWRRCNMLCTSGLVDDVVFSDNGPYGAGDVRPVCLNMTPNRAACISQRSVR